MLPVFAPKAGAELALAPNIAGPGPAAAEDPPKEKLLVPAALDCPKAKLGEEDWPTAGVELAPPVIPLPPNAPPNPPGAAPDCPKAGAGAAAVGAMPDCPKAGVGAAAACAVPNCP